MQAAAAREETTLDAEIRRLTTFIGRDESRSAIGRSHSVRFSEESQSCRVATSQRLKTAFVCRTCSSRHTLDGTLKSRGIFSGGESRSNHAKPGGAAAVSSHVHQNNLHEAFTDAMQKARLRQFTEAAKSGNFQKGREWYRNRSICQGRAAKCSWLAAIFALIGTASALWQHERIVVGEEPNSANMTIAKCANSICTLLCLVCIAFTYWFHTLIFRINRHCRRLVVLDERSAWPDVLYQPLFWIEVSSFDRLHSKSNFAGQEMYVHKTTARAARATHQLLMIVVCIACNDESHNK